MAKENPASVKKQDVESLKPESKKESKGTPSYLISFLMPHILIVLAALFVYAGTLNYGYIKFDDDLLVQHNASVLNNMTMKNIQRIFSTDAFLNPVGKEFYRPLQTLSYMVDMQINANNPAMFHISNFIFHCLTCIALFHLLILLKFDRRLSLAGVVLYAMHPLFCMAVTWIPGRGDLLLGLFVATSFICFIKSIRSTTQNNSKLYLAGTLFFYLLAMLSKETAIVLPVILAVYYVLEKGKKLNGIFIKDNVFLLYLVVGWLVITILWYIARSNAIPLPIAASQFGIEPFIKSFAVIPEFIAKFIIPINIAPIPSFSFMITALGLVLFVVLIVLTTIKKDKDYTKVLLGIAWFLMFLFPTMTYRHQLGDTAYSYLNHRAYLPMMGMLMFLFSIIPSQVQQKNINMIIIPVAVISVIFGIMSKIQTKIYDDSIGFYTSAIEANPQSAFCYNNRGKIFADNGELDQSMADFNKALELNPEDDYALSNRGYIKINQKDYRGAIADLREAIRLKPDLAAAYNNIGVSFFNLNQMTESLEAYNKAIALNTNYVDAYSNRALHKFTNHDIVGAIEDYSRAIMLSPSKYVYYADRATAYFRVQEFEMACSDWKRAAELGDQNSAQNFKNACQGGAKKILCQGSACP